MKKILILEDNPVTLKNLANIVQGIDIKNVVHPFSNIKDAYQCAMEKTIDLFVIDIVLDTSRPGDSSGLHFAENIRRIPHYNFVPIIFVTSLEDARLYTYEKLHCYSFIEKPFDVERLKRVVEQCLHFPKIQETPKTLYFRKDGIILAAERNDIVYAESINHIMHLHIRNGDMLSVPYITLKKLLDDIDSMDFIQCSKSVVLNKKYILNMDIPNRVIQLKDGLGCVDIGKQYKKKIRSMLQEFKPSLSN